MLRGTTPDSFAVPSLEAGEDAAVLYIVASKKMQFGPDTGKVKRVEMEVAFAREDGDWRIGTTTFLMDPDAVEKVTDTAHEPLANDDQDRETRIGGRVQRVALEADHALVVIRVLDEEHALFLPDQAYLKERGFDVTRLRSFVVVDASGHPHKSNSTKVWVTGLEIMR